MTETEQLAIASRWFELMNQGDLQQLVSLYSTEQLSFHPTLWNEHIRDCSRVRDYFVDFLARQPKIHSFTGTVFTIRDRNFLYTGSMKLSFTARSVVKNKLLARFSFVWVREEDNEWRIIHHHNSVAPSS